MYSTVITDSCNRTQNVTVRKTDDIFWLEIVGLPLLVIVCTLGNALNIIVMTSERSQSRSGNAHMVSKATKVFLLSMAVSDVILMWLQVPRYLAEYVQSVRIYGDTSDLAIGFKNFYGAQQWWSDASINFSDWVLIAFSIERLRSFRYLAYSFTTAKNSVNHGHQCVTLTSSSSSDDHAVWISPTTAESKSDSPAPLRNQPSRDRENGGRTLRRRTAVIIVISLLFGALLFTVENAVYYFYWRVQDPNDGQPYHTFRPDWITSWHFYHNILDVAMTVAKFAALLLINVHLILILIQQQTRNFFSHTGKVSALRMHRKGQSANKERTGTRLLIGCLVVYFVTHFPHVIYQCIRLAASSPYCLYLLTLDTALVARPIIRIILFSNYSVNFLLYFALSRKFREQSRMIPQRLSTWKARMAAHLKRKWLREPATRSINAMRLTALSSVNSNGSASTNVSVIGW